MKRYFNSKVNIFFSRCKLKVQLFFKLYQFADEWINSGFQDTRRYVYKKTVCRSTEYGVWRWNWYEKYIFRFFFPFYRNPRKNSIRLSDTTERIIQFSFTKLLKRRAREPAQWNSLRIMMLLFFFVWKILRIKSLRIIS